MRVSNARGFSNFFLITSILSLFNANFACSFNLAFVFISCHLAWSCTLCRPNVLGANHAFIWYSWAAGNRIFFGICLLNLCWSSSVTIINSFKLSSQDSSCSRCLDAIALSGVLSGIWLIFLDNWFRAKISFLPSFINSNMEYNKCVLTAIDWGFLINPFSPNSGALFKILSIISNSSWVPFKPPDWIKLWICPSAFSLSLLAKWI